MKHMSHELNHIAHRENNPARSESCFWVFESELSESRTTFHSVKACLWITHYMRHVLSFTVSCLSLLQARTTSVMNHVSHAVYESRTTRVPHYMRHVLYFTVSCLSGCRHVAHRENAPARNDSDIWVTNYIQDMKHMSHELYTQSSCTPRFMVQMSHGFDGLRTYRLYSTRPLRVTN